MQFPGHALDGTDVIESTFPKNGDSFSENEYGILYGR
jgi:hypothetical protein